MVACARMAQYSIVLSLEYTCQHIVHHVYCYYADGYIFSCAHMESTERVLNGISAFANYLYAHPPFKGYWDFDPEWWSAMMQMAIWIAAFLSGSTMERDKKEARREGRRNEEWKNPFLV